MVLSLVVIFSLWLIPALAVETGLSYGTYTGLGTQDLRVTIMKIIRIALGFVGVIAILVNLYAGYLWLTSAGNTQKIETAKRILRNGLIGLLIIFSAFAIVSFILSVLGVQGGNRYAGPPGPPGFSDGALGSGIIESVYPAPYAKDVARQTDILVTFKVEMDAGSICDDQNNNNICEGEPLKDGSVLIFKSSDGEPGAIAANKVLVSNTNSPRTFTFDPVDYLGDGVKNIWYEVKLTNNIKKDNGQSAFSGVNNYFKWPFEVGTLLDLDPVEADNLFPQPDKLPDVYSQSPAKAATASITVLKQPQIQVAAGFGAVTPAPNSAEIKISGTYNCSSDGSVSITASTPTSGTISTVPATLGFYKNWVLSGNKAPIGCGLTLEPAGLTEIAPGNLWTFTVTSAKTADTLTVASKNYTFAAAAGQINLGNDLDATALNIKNQIEKDNLPVVATVSGSKVNLAAKLAGKAGNAIALGASGNWAELKSFSGGSDPDLSAAIKDVPDKPRNAIIKIDFNEAISSTEVNANNIKIEYNKESDPSKPDSWLAVDGKYLLSNLYKTVEFLPNSQCGICSDNGQPCSSSSDCSTGGATCDFVTNSCGDKVYCLPVLKDGNTAISSPEYDPTNYRVSINAGLLKNCSTAADCLDGNFKICTQTPGTTDTGNVCQGTFSSVEVFYPEVSATPNGIRDVAHNSFNGNNNTYTLNSKVLGNAEGPQAQSGQPAYNLNLPNADTQGDDMVFSFYINKQIDLSPPKITEITPTIGQAAVSLSDPIAATFNKLLMSSTLKPGTGYRDGYCYCNGDEDCPTGHLCDTKTNKCKSKAGVDQFFCAEDRECKDWDGSGPQGPRCWNKKYISLINRTTFPVGWWASNEGLDTVSPQDGYSDITKAFLNHTNLGQVTQYGAEFGSGIKDVYQNCYLPSGGKQNAGSAECSVTAAQPYCCNGIALNRADWEASECFTGY